MNIELFIIIISVIGLNAFSSYAQDISCTGNACDNEVTKADRIINYSNYNIIRPGPLNNNGNNEKYFKNNTISITQYNNNKSIGVRVLVGAYSNGRGANNIENNKIIIKDSVMSEIFGGRTNSGKVHKNTVRVTGGKTKDVIGGYTYNGEIYENEVYIKDANADKTSYYGGYSDNNGLANKNKIVLTNIKTGIINEVVGGRSGIRRTNNNTIGETSGNTVIISGGGFEFIDRIHGGESRSNIADNTNNNTVTITRDGKFEIKKIIGGKGKGLGDASSNVITINTKGNNKSSNKIGTLISGYANVKGKANFNEINITSGNTEFETYSNDTDKFMAAGKTEDGETVGNKIKIDGGTFKDDIISGFSKKGGVKANDITIISGTFNKDIISGRSHGESKDFNNIKDVLDNTVEIKGGTLKGNIYGGLAGDNKTINNSVTISGTATYSGVFGGKSKGNSINNKVVISGSNNKGDITGGKSDNGNTETNTVTIDSGNIIGKIVAGHAVKGSAKNNTINVNGGIFNKNVELSAYIIGMGKTHTNNTININKEINIKSVKNVDNLNFNLKKSKKGKAILTTSDKPELKDTKIGLIDHNFNYKLDKGDNVILITSPKGVTDVKNKNSKFKITSGLIDYDVYLRSLKDKKQVVLTVKKEEVDKKNEKDFEGSHLSSIFSIVNANNLIIKSGLESIINSTNKYQDYIKNNDLYASIDNNKYDYSKNNNNRSWVGFSIIDASSYYYDSINLINRPVAGLLGIAHRFNINYGYLITGLFYESGKSSFYTDQETKGIVTGFGRSHYNGGGIISYLNLHNGFYTNGSLSIGKYKSSYANNNTNINYDSNSKYINTNLGVGYNYSLTRNLGLEASLLFSYSKLYKETLIVSNQHTVNINDINSKILSPMLKLNYSPKIYSNYYMGLGLEREFDSNISGNVNNKKLSNLNIKGTSYFISTGVKIKPSYKSPLEFNFNLKGVGGNQKGIRANIHLHYSF